MRYFTIEECFHSATTADGMPKWMHVGYKHPNGEQQRRQYLSMIHGKYYPMTN